MISILVALIILGVGLYLVSLIPMNESVRKVVFALAILFVVLYALQLLGLWSGLPARGLR